MSRKQGDFLFRLRAKRMIFPVIYLLLVVISFLPSYTEIPYDPRNSQDVIINILKISIDPYRAWGWIFHAATLLLLVWIALRPKGAGRILAAYIGVNYLIIAAVQTHAVTEKYGFALQTGAMVTEVLLGIVWLVTAFRGRLQASFKNVPGWRYLFLPMALLVFWSPLRIVGSAIQPNFDPLLLLTSPDYGLTYCFVTPVFLFLLILFYPKVDGFAFRLTAFNGLIYGVLNLTHWFNPDTVWMGVMHIPLLAVSIMALLLPRLARPVKLTPAPA